MRKKSAFTKNVLTLLTGSALGQIIVLTLTPIISRIYSPEHIGFFAVIMSVISGLTVVSCGRFELAIMKPEKEEEAQNLFSLALFFCTAFSFTIFVVSGLVCVFNPSISKWYFSVGPIVMLNGLILVNTNWAARNTAYKLISKSRVITAFSNSMLSIVLGLSGMLKSGLLISNFLGQILGNIPYFEARKLWIHSFKTPISTLKDTASRYIDFLRFNTLQALSDMILVNGVIYILPLFSDNQTIGWYSFAQRLLQAPFSFIGASLAQVFYQETNSLYRDKMSLEPAVRKMIFRAAIIALPIPIVLILFGSDLFSLVFGEKWRMAGYYSAILSPWVFFDFIRSTISQIPIIIDKQKTLLLFSLFGNIALISTMIWIGFAKQDIILGLMVLSFLMSVFTISIIGWIYKTSLLYIHQ